VTEENKTIPSFVTSVTGELGPEYWQPQTFQEWTEMTKTAALVNVWVQQQTHERSLRKTIGIWVFILITLQIVGVFAIVVLDAVKLLQLNERIVEFLIPSVLGEVFGMGFVVVKYLFRANTVTPFDINRK
jgi:hypothetical protein